ncbi:MAG: TorF family putative porin [Candidatus Latescibacterota bacterium]
MCLCLSMLLGVRIVSLEAAEVSTSLDMTSAYVFRGVTFNDGLAAQPGIEMSGFPIPVTVGVWGNLDLGNYGDALEEGQFSEIDLYGSADIPLPIDWLGLSVGYTEYTYPSGGGKADRELNLTGELGFELSPSLSVNYGLGGAIRNALYLELGLGHEIEWSPCVSVGIDAALGYVNPDEGDGGISHYALIAGLSYRFLSASLTYIGQVDDQVLPDGIGSYDANVIGTIGVSYGF